MKKKYPTIRWLDDLSVQTDYKRIKLESLSKLDSDIFGGPRDASLTAFEVQLSFIKDEIENNISLFQYTAVVTWYAWVSSYLKYKQEEFAIFVH